MKFGRRCAQQSTGPSTANCERRSTVQRWILVAVLLAVQALSIGAVSYSFSLWVDPLAADFDVERKAILGLLGVFGIATCAASAIRSEERRVGNECVSTCRSRWSPNH